MANESSLGHSSTSSSSSSSSSLSLALALALPLGACASHSPVTTLAPVHTRASISAAPNHAQLPDGAELRAALSDDGALGLLVLTADQRIWAHLYLRPSLDGPMPTVRVEFRDRRDEVISAEAEVISGGLVGAIDVGDGFGSWRVASEPSGQLSGRRWSPALAHRCPSMRLARDIATELDEIAPEIGTEAAMSAHELRALLEDVELAQLALELGLRACEGHGRASLPTLTGPFAWR